MADSVELLLDAGSEDAVRGDWLRLEGLGLPSQSRHTAPSNRPHITLVAAPVIGGQYDDALEEAVAGLPLKLCFGGLLLFGGYQGKYVLTRQVVLSEALAELHRRVWRVLADLDTAFATTRPGQWSPHVTLARGVTQEQLGTAIPAVHGAAGTPRAVEARRWDSAAKRTVHLGPG